MKISYTDYEHISVLTLSGDFSTDDVEAFERVCTDRMRERTRHILIDCEHLEFVDSRGLESWIDLQQKLGEKGGQLRLLKPDETIQTILRLTRLTPAFEKHDSLEQAVRSLR
ncbi:MAG: anti-sigma factor antagonist [Phycisphaeraceae bacterium]|nr:MAG: anti-sigma factor antagonist [Phycisphaeraceae bacterium]